MTWPGVIQLARGGDNLLHKCRSTKLGFCTTTLVIAAHEEFMHIRQQNVDICLLSHLLDGCYVINKAFSFVFTRILKETCTHQILICRLTRFILMQAKKSDRIIESQGDVFLSPVNLSGNHQISHING